MSFHDVRLELPAALGLSGGPERRTDVAELSSGAEQRNARWFASRRRWEIGGGLLRADDAHALVAFFEARAGRLHGFRFRDPLDWKSCAPSRSPAASDQVLGAGDGAKDRFVLVKLYSSGGASAIRRIRHPAAGRLTVAVDGLSVQAAFDAAAGEVVLAQAPPVGAIVTAGFEFDAPVRFDTDALELSLEGPDAVRVGRLSLVELAT